VLKPIIDWTDC